VPPTPTPNTAQPVWASHVFGGLSERNLQVFAREVKDYPDVTLDNLYKPPRSSAASESGENVTVVVDSDDNVSDFTPESPSMRPPRLRGPQRSQRSSRIPRPQALQLPRVAAPGASSSAANGPRRSQRILLSQAKAGVPVVDVPAGNGATAASMPDGGGPQLSPRKRAYLPWNAPKKM
jgi:hypothetical protein